MELEDDGPELGGPASSWVDPDDRLWRHPSEMAALPAARRTPDAGTGLPRSQARLWSVAVLAGVIGALLATGVLSLSGGLAHSTTTVVKPVEQIVAPWPTTVSVTTAEPAVVAIARRLRPAIVGVTAEGDRGRMTGSGVVVRTDGIVLTDDRAVVGASSITVTMADGRQLKARLVGADGQTDVAVLQIDGAGRWTVAPMGSAADLKVGQTAVAVGWPLELAASPLVSAGVVSALGRRVESRSGAGAALYDMIQTDAPIAPGWSGGALVDEAGAVIGITTEVAADDPGTPGAGFAVPIDVARDAADQLLTTGRVTHCWLGVEGGDVDADTAHNLSIDGGAMVEMVRSGSPAAGAGLVPRDIIVSVDSRAVRSMAALAMDLRSRRPGDTVTLRWRRGDDVKTAQLKLVERPRNL
jgi:S1-C subfamily serine protease